MNVKENGRPLIPKRLLSIIALLMDKPDGVGVLELKYTVFGKGGAGGQTFERGLEDLFSMGIIFVSRYDERGRPVIALQRKRFEKPNAEDPLTGKLSGNRTKDSAAFRRQRVSFSVFYAGERLSLNAACNAAGLRAGFVYNKIRDIGHVNLSDKIVQGEFDKALSRLKSGDYVFVPRKDVPLKSPAASVDPVFSKATSVFKTVHASDDVIKEKRGTERHAA